VAFSELDHAVQHTVRFGDGSVISMQGRGIMTFTGKTGEQIKLARVLYIPRLKNNIISLVQLDKMGARWRLIRVFSECGIAATDSLSRYNAVRIGNTFSNPTLPLVSILESGKEKKEKLNAGTFSMATLAIMCGAS
jgi:hypothetical protein